MNLKGKIKAFFISGIDLLRYDFPFVLPLILYIHVIVCLIIKDTTFFYNNDKLIDIIDTPFFIYSVLHSRKHYNEYRKVVQNCLTCIWCILFIKFSDWINGIENVPYYTMYWILIVLTALFSVWDNLNFRFIKK